MLSNYQLEYFQNLPALQDKGHCPSSLFNKLSKKIKIVLQSEFNSKDFSGKATTTGGLHGASMFFCFFSCLDLA